MFVEDYLFCMNSTFHFLEGSHSEPEASLIKSVGPLSFLDGSSTLQRDILQKQAMSRFAQLEVSGRGSLVIVISRGSHSCQNGI